VSEYNQQDATFHNLFISVRRSTCFRRFFRPSSGAQKLHMSVLVWQIPDAVCAVLSSWWWKENPSETCRVSYRNNKLRKFSSCRLSSENLLAMHGPVNVRFNFCMSGFLSLETIYQPLYLLLYNPELKWFSLKLYMQLRRLIFWTIFQV